MLARVCKQAYSVTPVADRLYEPIQLVVKVNRRSLSSEKHCRTHCRRLQHTLDVRTIVLQHCVRGQGARRGIRAFMPRIGRPRLGLFCRILQLCVRLLSRAIASLQHSAHLRTCLTAPVAT